MYDLVSFKKIAALKKANDVVVRLNKSMKTKSFNFQNKRARHLLAIGMAYVPALSNSAAALFIPCILASYFAEIGYTFAQTGMGKITFSWG